MNTLVRFLRCERASVPVEYGALGALGAVLLISGFNYVGSTAAAMFGYVDASIGSATGASGP